MDNLALLQNFSNAQRQLSQVKQLQVLRITLIIWISLVTPTNLEFSISILELNV